MHKKIVLLIRSQVGFKKNHILTLQLLSNALLTRKKKKNYYLLLISLSKHLIQSGEMVYGIIY